MSALHVHYQRQPASANAYNCDAGARYYIASTCTSRAADNSDSRPFEDPREVHMTVTEAIQASRPLVYTQ